MLYSMSFAEFQLKKRLDALKAIGLDTTFYPETNSVDIKHHQSDVLGSGHTEAAKFICDPVYSPKMYDLDAGICKLVAELHYEFWCWRHSRPFINPEEAVVYGIKQYLINLDDCDKQDAYLAYTPEQLKAEVYMNLRQIFTEDFWMHSTISHNITRSVVQELVENMNLDWKLIHRNMFKG